MDYKTYKRLDKFRESIRPIIKRMLNEENTEKEPTTSSRLKRSVEIFYNRMDKSALDKMMDFETKEEKGQALLEFIKRLNVRPTEMTYLINLVRNRTKK